MDAYLPTCCSQATFRLQCAGKWWGWAGCDTMEPEVEGKGGKKQVFVTSHLVACWPAHGSLGT